MSEPLVNDASAGWFGKLPMLGDFASRRLPEAFIKPWDDWLQPNLATAKDAIGERWLDLYLTFPVWRFAIPAGLVGETGWVGVFLPSVDRVGRCFPLTICEAVPGAALESAGLVAIDTHLVPFAEAGIAALDAASVDALEQLLGAIQPLPRPTTANTMPAVALEAWLPRRRPLQPEETGGAGWSLSEELPVALGAAASRFVISALGSRVLWWSPAGPPETGVAGALLLEPYPFSNSLLGNLIGRE